MTFCYCAQEALVSLLDLPGERGYLFRLQRNSVVGNTGATRPLRVLKNDCACHIMSNTEKLTAEI